MTRFITPVDATIFTAILGIVMILTGREVGGAIVVSSSLFAFIFFEWFLYHYLPTQQERAAKEEAREHNEMQLKTMGRNILSVPDEPIQMDDVFEAESASRSVPAAWRTTDGRSGTTRPRPQNDTCR